MTSFSSSSSSRNHESEPIYDVFLSSKSGDSTDKNYSFTSNLCTQLRTARISVFWDNDDGSCSGDDEQISPSLLQVIQNSKIGVVVLSTSYASSRRCLDVLEQVIECRRIVLPVFLNISCHELCYQIYGFGDAFGDLMEMVSDREKVESWKLAFARICQIHSRLEVKSSRNEEEDTKNVAEQVYHLLDIMFVAEHPIGIESRVQDMVNLLNCGLSKGILVIGIWGMVGSGKTTIAKAIYNKMSRKYEGKSFLQDISEIWKQDKGQESLQEKLLSDIKKGTDIKIDDIESGKRILCETLPHERILLVLDDVDKLEQLNALCRSREWFGSDSIIIITTRDKGILDEIGVDHLYIMKEMNETESATLFSLHAFKQPCPKEDFVELSRDAVAYCGGLPLALSELGRELFGKDRNEWKRLLGRYKRIPNPKIHNALKRSFDGLSDDRMKDAFLEIACFYVGLDQNVVIQKLNKFEDIATRRVSVLVERSLLIVDEMNKLQMHVLLWKMGREIFRQRSEMPKIYDVFFSYSNDTPLSLTSCLIGSLEKVGISVYRDVKVFTREDRISPSLVQIIQKCRIFVVILSRDFARSRRFLDVIEEIVKCRRIIGQHVLTILFNLDPNVVIDHPDHYIGDFTKMTVDKDKVKSWEIALANFFTAIFCMHDHCRLRFKREW